MPKNTNINLANKVARFKKWASSRQGTYGEWECDYQHWDELWKAAEESMKDFSHENSDIETINNLLYTIARDNEIERLRKEAIKYPELLRQLARFGVDSSEPDAKWQVSVSVADAQLPDAADLIRPYLNDNNEYVRRRSLLAIAPFSPNEAEEIAKVWMDKDYEYSRIAGLHVLDILKSECLELYLERHANDSSKYVRSNVEDIRKQRYRE
ncbi:MAG TPA: hypothetical protein PK055_00865 [Gammaproteobacteria bacterium]|nr:hypothetical protein [Xanthomonadales bacterium]HOP21586.1 hypothetical protein [Gammaproteobacteria bacterium]HPI96144.1 hypothetical protein [Gammaproteobacteria bacterium]HPQ86185.1 hypothetical protein [Gammaproteobacteria bacterium]